MILEGMLLARPVIAAAAGGVPEFVEHGRSGFLVPPRDVGALAAQIGELAADPLLCRRVGEQAQAYATERFSLTQHVRAMTALYESIMRDTDA